LKTKKISFKKLETLIGHLNHSASACPLMRCYLNRIRNTLTTWHTNPGSKKCERYLAKSAIEDIKLWTNHFLLKISQGISLNLVSFCRPSYICWSDACLQGLGGYGYLDNVWHFQIPSSHHCHTISWNNLLEFIASVISVWVAIIGLQGTSMCRRSICVHRIPYKSGQFFYDFLYDFL
jgi:hypothetical protein